METPAENSARDKRSFRSPLFATLTTRCPAHSNEPSQRPGWRFSPNPQTLASGSHRFSVHRGPWNAGVALGWGSLLRPVNPSANPSTVPLNARGLRPSRPLPPRLLSPSLQRLQQLLLWPPVSPARRPPVHSPHGGPRHFFKDKNQITSPPYLKSSSSFWSPRVKAPIPPGTPEPCAPWPLPCPPPNHGDLLSAHQMC